MHQDSDKILLMDKILYDPKDSKLWELWSLLWVMQDFVHQQ